ncbi:hypothetical protein R1flu_016730 [Riccia fluitans]|uniref:Uncharacterized protein n=1 Tax=Riccia fluitans TaxID=41844 RepID=A0ABD1YMN9_9MARC
MLGIGVMHKVSNGKHGLLDLSFDQNRRHSLHPAYDDVQYFEEKFFGRFPGSSFDSGSSSEEDGEEVIDKREKLTPAKMRYYEGLFDWRPSDEQDSGSEDYQDYEEDDLDDSLVRLGQLIACTPAGCIGEYAFGDIATVLPGHPGLIIEGVGPCRVAGLREATGRHDYTRM